MVSAGRTLSTVWNLIIEYSSIRPLIGSLTIFAIGRLSRQVPSDYRRDERRTRSRHINKTQTESFVACRDMVTCHVTSHGIRSRCSFSTISHAAVVFRNPSSIFVCVSVLQPINHDPAVQRQTVHHRDLFRQLIATKLRANVNGPCTAICLASSIVTGLISFPYYRPSRSLWNKLLIGNTTGDSLIISIQLKLLCHCAMTEDLSSQKQLIIGFISNSYVCSPMYVWSCADVHRNAAFKLAFARTRQQPARASVGLQLLPTESIGWYAGLSKAFT